MTPKKRLVIALTGASGAIYGVRLLEVMKREGGWETHLVISRAGLLNLRHELGMGRREICELAHVAHDIDDVGAAIASGAFKTEGMIIAPCSMKTLSGIAHAFSDNLISRAADVTLKERRRLVLVPRETPLNLAHIRNMASVTEMGGIVFPPLPAFYGKAKSLDELVNESVGRIIELFGIDPGDLYQPWSGIG